MPTRDLEQVEGDRGRLVRLSSLLVAATLALIGVCLWLNHGFFHDDTYITLRYARHLLAGLGPVWNPHGPRVEGFTSTLHLLLVAAVGSLRMPLPVAARVVNVISHASLLLFVFFYLRRRAGRLGAMLAVMMIAASWMFLVWDLGGLDAVLYAALGTVGVLTGTRAFDPAEREPLRLAVLGSLALALATLARPEGALVLGGLWVLLALLTPRTLGKRMKLLAAAVGVAALVLLPVVLFRWFYFHAIAPNTMYAKIGGIGRQELVTLGIRYLVKFFITPPLVGVFTIGGAILCLHLHRFTARDGAVWTLMGLSAASVVVAGGDHMIAFRFCLLLYALLAVMLVLHLARLGALTARRSAGVLAVLLVALALQAVPRTLNPRDTDIAAAEGRVIGEYIAGHWPVGSMVALNTAGSTPYYADRMQYIDMLGLNDAAIARRKNIPNAGPWMRMVGHLKGDGASVLARHPDYIILGPSEGTTSERKASAYFIGDYEIGVSPIFAREYSVCQVAMPSGPAFTYYQRRDAGRSCP